MNPLGPYNEKFIKLQTYIYQLSYNKSSYLIVHIIFTSSPGIPDGPGGPSSPGGPSCPGAPPSPCSPAFPLSPLSPGIPGSPG